ncbi:MAG: surface-adhesin E family protein [Acidobacteriota bacterium]
MKITSVASLLFVLLSLAASQEKDRWQRIYSSEDADVDLNISTVILGADYTGRVQFRISLSRPQPAPGKSDAKYKSVIETIEFKCPERLYRIIEVKRFDNKGNPVDTDENKPAEEWSAVKGGMMNKLLTHGCELIWEKKKKP